MKHQPVGSALCQGAISDLLEVCSALSSFEDALDQAVYEEIDYLVTPKKEDLLSSPGEFPCLDLGISTSQLSAGCEPGLLSICRPHIYPKLTEARGAYPDPLRALSHPLTPREPC